jgi:hypothetical protein
MHASIQATLYNAHFDTKGVPWTAEDLLGRGDREKRTMKSLKDKFPFRNQRPTDIDESLVPDFILELERNQKQTVN